MVRLFFDVVGAEHPLLDFHGQLVRSVDGAREVAEVIALDHACSEGQGQAETNVVVRDAKGNVVMSVPIQSTDSVAA
jgi:hypothetical protein